MQHYKQRQNLKIILLLNFKCPLNAPCDSKQSYGHTMRLLYL